MKRFRRFLRSDYGWTIQIWSIMLSHRLHKTYNTLTIIPTINIGKGVNLRFNIKEINITCKWLKYGYNLCVNY